MARSAAFSRRSVMSGRAWEAVGGKDSGCTGEGQPETVVWRPADVGAGAAWGGAAREPVASLELPASELRAARTRVRDSRPAVSRERPTSELSAAWCAGPGFKSELRA